MRKITLTIIFLIITISIILIYPKEEKEIMNNNEETKKNFISMMLENDNGKYEEKTDITFPTEGYLFNAEKSGCENGGTLTWNKEQEKIEASLLTSDKCYAYFDKWGGLKIIASTPKNLNANQAGMYRYQGSKDKVDNNYICFGTSDKTECLANQDKYMYRILGITEDGLIKVIKNTPLENSYVYTGNLSSLTKWSESDLFNGLNNDYYLNNENFDYFQDNNWLDKIVDFSWLHGAIRSGAPYATDINVVYDIETGSAKSYWIEKVDNSLKGENGIVCVESNSGVEVCYQIFNEEWSEKVTAKIGLMYSHDYYFSVQKDGYNCNYDVARNSNGGVVDPVCANAWLNYTDSNEHILTRIGYYEGGNQYNSWELLRGVIDNNSINGKRKVRPVFYIKANILLNGNGSIEEPYIIKK